MFDHAGGALAFTTFAVCSGWLATRKFVGHRSWIVHVFIWTVLRSLLSVELMWAGYWGNRNSLLVNVCLTMATTVAMTLAVHTLVALSDFLITLTRTEASEMVRRDHTADKEQKNMLFKYMAQRNRESSQQILAEATRSNL